ncbi:MAG: HRDC domain-containing protein [Acidimicrobiales bacterium]
MLTLLTDQDEFASVVAQLVKADRYAIDTEFHRERTYFPQVALIQLAWDDQVVLVDPLAIDFAPFADVLHGPGVCVMHAGGQDLEVLDIACGAQPSVMFDTQIAAGFLGLSSASLASLLKKFLNVDVAKGDRLTDWLQRPLTDAQLVYAAGDVDNLLALASILEEKLVARNRLAWAIEECDVALHKPRNRRTPEEAVARIKEARSLKGDAYRVATALAAWRERRAATTDTPVRQVLPDIAIVAIAQTQPTNVEALKKLRGVDGRHLRNSADQEIISAVQVGLRMPKDSPPPVVRGADLPRELRPVLPLLTSWISQICRDNDLDPAQVATRSDIEALLSNSEHCRLNMGWRAELVGEPIHQLVSGRAAVAFDDGRLVLEARSGESVANEGQ